ncbi:ComEA family DNA-binding protein [Micromonospora sp. WMMD980]|uniref:ComEA family DNA-binding protein n=1 Tax=Micromonospora sp. WMMD980 TaxID=3016088 RepID=UPI002417691E|nr:ComEA family DNA-binding protein [Micromonospora sp. WMMD980]MDG4799180.1 ComEA family DNA-binding protein [Micromonospora sp. WMMD980]
MSDDEETTVRRRLARLFTPAGRPAAVPAPAGGAPHDVRAATPEPPPAYPFPEPARPGPRQPARPGLRHGRPEPGRPSTPRMESDSVFVEHDPDGPDASPPPEPGRGLASRLPGPGAFDPGRRGVRALAAVAALVVLAAAVWAWRSRPTAEPVRPVAPAGEATAGVATQAAGAVTEATPAASTGQVVVAVAGKVRRPGLVRLPAGARLADAVEAAGGALPGVDVALLNPARKVTDGELILVGVSAPPGQAAPGPAAGGAPGGPAAGPVNLNTATLAQLDALPGVGPVLAQRILDHREQHGGFRSVSDLRQVEGIGDARYEQLKELVTV